MIPSTIRREERALHAGPHGKVFQVFRGNVLLFERLTPIEDAEILDWLVRHPYVPAAETDIRKTFERVRRELVQE